jgi:hypothetical protein
MRPVVYTITGSGTSGVCPIDHYIAPTNVTLGATITGTVNYTVQYTFDDVFAVSYVPASGNWVDHPSLTAQTTSKDSNLAYPARGVRLVVNSGSGTVRLTIIQAGGGV